MLEILADAAGIGPPPTRVEAKKATGGLPSPSASLPWLVSELLNPEVRRWIAGLHAQLPTPAHEIALAMLRENYLTNEMLRQWGVDRIAAGQVLRDLVDQGLAVKEGGRRYAQYVLDPAVWAAPRSLTSSPTCPTSPRRSEGGEQQPPAN